MLKTNNNYHYYLLRYCRVDAYVDRVSQSQLTINVLHAGDAYVAPTFASAIK